MTPEEIKEKALMLVREALKKRFRYPLRTQFTVEQFVDALHKHGLTEWWEEA